MKWRVEISGIEGNERLLRDVLDALKITIIEEQGSRFLTSEKFDSLKTAGEVRDEAKRIRRILDEAAVEDAAMRGTFTVGSSVLEERPGEPRRKHGFVDIIAGTLQIRGHAAVMAVGISVSLSEDDRRRIEEEQKERDYQRLRQRATLLVVSGYRDERVLQVRHLLRGDLTPNTMGHIAELIEADLGDAINELASGKQWSSFNGSINHPDAVGAQARHIVPRHQPPRKVMRLPDAQEFIRKVAARWMDRKAT